MKIGFLTGCLGDIPLYEKAKFARSAGFQALEISAWPKENTRDYSGSAFAVPESLTEAQPDHRVEPVQADEKPIKKMKQKIVSANVHDLMD